MPTIPSVELSLETLIRECSLNTKTSEEHLNNFRFAVREKTHEVFKYHKFHYDFTDTLTCYNDEKRVISYIRPSYRDFLNKVLLFLNMGDYQNKEDDVTLTKKMLERVEALRKVQTEHELKNGFPILYNDLMMGRKYIREVERMPIETEEERIKKQGLSHYYYASGLKRSLHSVDHQGFIDTQCEMYTRFILRRGQYKELIESSKSFNNYLKNNFDKDKIAIYAMYKYLKAAKKALDEEQLRAYLDLVERYQNSSYNKDVHVTTNDGLVINQDVILSLIASLKKRLESKDRLAGWVLLPPGKKQKKDSDEDSSGQRTLGTFREPEDRKGFYEGTGYIARIVGIEQNEGYTAYVYPNGEVILDNTKKNENGRHAIYHIKAVNFELLSRLDKTTLRSLPEVERIIHNKNWQERVKGIIQEEGTESDQAAAAELHSKLKRG